MPLAQIIATVNQGARVITWRAHRDREADMSQEHSTTGPSEFDAFAERLSEFRGSLPRRQQLFLDTLVVTACSARGEVRGYGMVDSFLERVRAYWLDPAQFDPRHEVVRDSDEDRALLTHIRRLAYNDV
jgi:hypothetical protein